MSLDEFVHLDDQWLISPRDLRVMEKLGSEGLEQMKQEADLGYLIRYTALVVDGVKETEADCQVRQSHPVYYSDLNERCISAVETTLNSEDAMLPIVISKRLGFWKLSKVKKKMNETYTSFNACVRDLHRSGMLK